MTCPCLSNPSDTPVVNIEISDSKITCCEHAKIGDDIDSGDLTFRSKIKLCCKYYFGACCFFFPKRSAGKRQQQKGKRES